MGTRCRERCHGRDLWTRSAAPRPTPSHGHNRGAAPPRNPPRTELRKRHNAPRAPPDPDPALRPGGCGIVRAGAHPQPAVQRLRSAVWGRRRDPPAGLRVPIPPPAPPERRPLGPCLGFPTAPQHRPGAPQGPRAAEGPPSPHPLRRPPRSPRACRCTQSQRCQSRRAPPPEGSAVSVRPTPAPPGPIPGARPWGVGGGGVGLEGKPPRGAPTVRKGRAPPPPPPPWGQRERREKRYTLTGNLRGATALRVPPPHALIPVPLLPRSPRTAAPRIAAPGGAAASPPPPPPGTPRTPIPARQPRPCPPPAGSRSRTALRRRSGGAGAAGGQRQQQRGGGGGGGSGLSAARSPPGDSSDGDSADGDRGGGGGGGTSGGRSSNRRPSPPAGPGGSSGGAALWRRGAGSGAGRCAPGFFSNFSSGFMAAERLAGPWAVRGGAGRGGGSARARAPERVGGARRRRPAPPGTCPPPAPGGASRSRVAPPARSAAQLRSLPYAHRAARSGSAHPTPPPPPPKTGVGKARGYEGEDEGGFPLRLCSRFASIPRCLATPGRGGGESGGGGRTQPCPRVSPPRAAPRCAPLGPSARGRDGKPRHGGGGGHRERGPNPHCPNCSSRTGAALARSCYN